VGGLAMFAPAKLMIEFLRTVQLNARCFLAAM
jgi:hypothetical protein